MESYDIVIVGGGVRSVVLLERILARLDDDAAGLRRVAVIDPWPPGSGRIWRTEQPLALVMNTLASASSVYPDPTVRVDGAILAGPTLLEWCRVVAGAAPERVWPDGMAATTSAATIGLSPELAAAAAELEPWHYPPRALFGEYLRWAYADVVVRLRARGVAVEHVPAVAVDVDDDGVVVLDDGRRLGAGRVVLAIGWLLGVDDGAGAQPAGGPIVLGADSPIDQPLDRIADGATVLVRGLGMSFFDTVTLLTSGRGGGFEQDGDGLVYVPSGREPRILASSRGGAPFRAQSRHTAPPEPTDLRWFRRAADRGEGFEAILRALRRDADRSYYRVLSNVSPGSVGAADGLLARADPDVSTDEEWEAAVAASVVDPALRFDPRRFDAPIPAFADSGDYAAWFAGAVDADLDEAARGPASAAKAALLHYVSARSQMPDIAGFGRLGDAHPDFLEYLRFAGRAGGVPPEFRVQELRALLTAGIVQPFGPDPTVVDDGAGLTARTANGDAMVVDAVVDTRMPARTVASSGSRLVRALHARGVVRSWSVGGRETGSIDIDPMTGAVIGADGSAHPRIHSVGSPSEDARVFTIIAPIPGTNSPVIREADAVVRAVLDARSGGRPEATAAVWDGESPTGFQSS